MATLVAAAVLSPLVYLGAKAWADGSSAPLLAYLGRKDFPRYFDRIRWLLVLAGLPWLCRRTGLTGGWRLGLRVPDGTWRRAATWFAAGAGMVTVVASGQLASGVATWSAPGGAGGLAAGAAGVAVALVSAALIAFFEELIFRGVVFQLAAATLRLLPAALAAALFFALLHFQRVPGHLWPEGARVGWSTGFTVAWWSLTSIASSLDPATLLALVLAGFALCLVFYRTGSLYPAMGLHAGWVFVAQLHRRWLHVDTATASERAVALWGGRSMIDGVLPLVLLGLVTAVAVGLTVGQGRRRRTDSPIAGV